jgi:xanthine dehydrogenase accessory factor
MLLFRTALELVDAGERPVLATVIDAGGSTPRHRGAHMLVREDGEIVGTIGGGRVEHEVVSAAREVAAGGPARRARWHLVRDLAMCCGGAMELYLEPVPQSRDALAQVLDAIAHRRRCALVTDLDGSPKRVEPLADGAGRKPALDGERLTEPVLPTDRLVLFGGGHVSRAIGPLASTVGFEVHVCDDGEVRELDEAPPWAASLIESFDLRDVERALGSLGVGDYVVILTRDHAIDQRILETIIVNEELAYLGLIGSRGKAGRFRRRLEAKGLLTPERWGRLHSPVGLDIAAETPEEIAVAVVAELVRERNR